MDKYDQLYGRIIEKLNSSKVKNNEEVVSAKFVSDSVSHVMAQYNNVLIGNQKEIIQLMNKSLGYKKLTPKYVRKALPRVVNIVGKITEDGTPYSVVVFEDGNSIKLSGNYKSVRVIESSFTDCNILDCVANWKNVFCIYFACLQDFADSFPGVAMNFGVGVNNTLDQEINDGFMKCTVKICEPDDTTVAFSSIEDYYTSITRTRRYAELYDYIAYFNREFQDKIAVNVDELNPFVKSCVVNRLRLLGKHSDKSFTLSK